MGGVVVRKRTLPLSYLDAHDIICAFSFLFVFLFKLDVIALYQDITKSGILHVAFMKKNVFPRRRRYKTETFHRIKKFHNTLRHKPTLLNRMKYNQFPAGRNIRPETEK